MGLHFQSFARMGRPDAVDEFGERFLFVGIESCACQDYRIMGTIGLCNG